jgi:hypothetical protein
MPARALGQGRAVQPLLDVGGRFQLRRLRHVPALLVEAREERLERLRRPPAPCASLHERRVGHDPEEPGREARLAAERGQMAIPEGGLVTRRGAPRELLVIDRHGGERQPTSYRVRIAVFTLAASSGVTCWTQCSWAACVVTFWISSFSVAALASKEQPGTMSPHAMCLSMSPPLADGGGGCV